MVLSKLRSPLRVHSDELVLEEDSELGNISFGSNPINGDMRGKLDIILLWS